MSLTYELIDDRSGNFRVWSHPEDGLDYVLGVDPAENKRRDLSHQQRRSSIAYRDDRPDYCSITVLELVSGSHVASWHGYFPADEFATIVAAVGWYYNDALVVPETNGPGIAVISRLSETLAYPNIYRQQYYNVLDRDPLAPTLGFRTDAHSRKILMARVSEWLNTGQILTHDADLVRELRTIEFDNNGTERARGNNKDDRVFSLALALEGRYHHIVTHQPREMKPKNDSEAYANHIWRLVEKEQEESSERRRARQLDDLGGGLDRFGHLGLF